MKSTLLIFFITITLQFNAQNNVIHNISSVEFYKLIQAGKNVLLDVRTKSEFENEHIKDASNLNFYALDFKNKLDLLHKDEKIFLYCTTGYRSAKVADILKNKGFTNIYNLEKGIMDWNLKKLPVVKGAIAEKNKIDKYTIDKFNNLIDTDSLVFIDFYAPWCGPCRKMMPMIDSLKVEYFTKIKMVKINADASKKLNLYLQTSSVPLIEIYKDKKVIYKKEGLITRDELVNVFEDVLMKYTTKK
ncbi:MAG: hypothetical protein GXO79_03480 [Chlorobi bacterium]|nr:hypothetical protein [Chlorobiota bacterium]